MYKVSCAGTFSITISPVRSPPAPTSTAFSPFACQKAYAYTPRRTAKINEANTIYNASHAANLQRNRSIHVFIPHTPEAHILRTSCMVFAFSSSLLGTQWFFRNSIRSLQT